jgi:hypothetical protein
LRRARFTRSNSARLQRTLGLTTLATALTFPFAAGAVEPSPPIFLAEGASPEVRTLGAWAMQTGDHQGGPFIIVDKVEAKVFVFSAKGVLLGTAPALLGMAKGDTSPDGIGARKLASITPAERITPAGRFVAAIGRNLSGKDILWIDYDEALSLHRVDTAKPRERRLQRLATPTTSDNRISYGCVNVPAAFFDTFVVPLFNGRTGVVYILPETQSVERVFFAKP